MVRLLTVGAGAQASLDAAAPAASAGFRRGCAAQTNSPRQVVAEASSIFGGRALALDDDQILRRRPELVGFRDLERAVELGPVAGAHFGVVETLARHDLVFARRIRERDLVHRARVDRR